LYDFHKITPVFQSVSLFLLDRLFLLTNSAVPSTSSWMLLVPETFQMHRTLWYPLAVL